MNNPIRSFCSANTCSTRARIFDFRIVGPPGRFVHRAAFRLLAMDVADEAILGQEYLVGRRSVGMYGNIVSSNDDRHEILLSNNIRVCRSRNLIDASWMGEILNLPGICWVH